MTGSVTGGRYLLYLKQPSSGAAGTITWQNGNLLWSGGTAPTLTSTNSKMDIISFVYELVNNKFYGQSALNF